MNQIKISICMATRNRGAFMGATLECIVGQATDEVEIVILDGASTDNTEEVVRRYQERFPRLCYFRQETNMGVDRDFAKAVDLAHGEYCWLFCDDDLLKPGAIQVVLDAIKDDYALIIANSEVWNADLSKLLEPKRVPLERNRIYKSNENHLLLADTGYYLTFIGGVIIKRQLWATREKENYFSSRFIHVGVIFQRPLPGDALVIAEPLILIRYANASWLGKSFEIWMFKWPGLVWSFANFPDSVKYRVCPKEPWRSPKTLLHFRATGVYTKREYTEWLKPRLGSHWARLVSKAIAHFPGRTANLLAFIYYSIFRRPSSRLLILLDLANSPFCFWRPPMRHRTPFKEQPNVMSAGSQVSSSISGGNDKPLDI
jgi:glycosyltransferase involved in cell wall biosynthesis